MAVLPPSRFGAALRAGALGLACGLPAMASADAQHLGPMVVDWPTGGGVVASLGSPACPSCKDYETMEAPVLSNFYWQGEDQTFHVHRESDEPLHQWSDAQYTVAMRPMGFDITVATSVQRDIIGDTTTMTLPRGFAQADARVGFRLDVDTDVLINGQAGFLPYATSQSGVKQTTAMTLSTWKNVDGRSVEVQVWAPLKGLGQFEDVLHLKAGIYYDLSASTMVDMFSTPSHPYNETLLGATINLSLSVVPEPGMADLWGLGLIGLGMAGMKRRGRRGGMASNMA